MHYDVVLYGESGVVSERLDCETAGLAVQMAEQMHPGKRALVVMQQVLVVGRCDMCRGVLLDNDNVRFRKGKPRCEGCL